MLKQVMWKSDLKLTCTQESKRDRKNRETKMTCHVRFSGSSSSFTSPEDKLITLHVLFLSPPPPFLHFFSLNHWVIYASLDWFNVSGSLCCLIGVEEFREELGDKERIEKGWGMEECGGGAVRSWRNRDIARFSSEVFFSPRNSQKIEQQNNSDVDVLFYVMKMSVHFPCLNTHFFLMHLSRSIFFFFLFFFLHCKCKTRK